MPVIALTWVGLVVSFCCSLRNFETTYMLETKSWVRFGKVGGVGSQNKAYVFGGLHCAPLVCGNYQVSYTKLEGIV